MDEAPTLTFESGEAFEAWLAKNYQNTEGVMVKVAKVSSVIPSVTENELIDIGLCWGWVSGIRRSFDDKYYLQKYVLRQTGTLHDTVPTFFCQARDHAGSEDTENYPLADRHEPFIRQQ